ncbi:MAG: hypothetical protein ACK5LJ_09835 [Paracoccus sp. (in: a-proteobacteria)]
MKKIIAHPGIHLLTGMSIGILYVVLGAKTSPLLSLIGLHSFHLQFSLIPA